METESILKKEGMDEKDIALVYEYDKEYFKSHRRYEEHRAMEIPEQILFYEDNIEESMYFLDIIEDMELHRVLVSLKPEELKIIELHVIDGLTVTFCLLLEQRVCQKDAKLSERHLKCSVHGHQVNLVFPNPIGMDNKYERQKIYLLRELNLMRKPIW